ncbi:hypothetical protein ACFY0A_24485 [Streptomyces sp. NPDC001698]|uniref:hypothetical protein n=1 Tax=unclassified Streptomyces TaxID=2593676 RepID=UPI0036B0A0AD
MLPGDHPLFPSGAHLIAAELAWLPRPAGSPTDEAGRPALSWQFDQDALQAEAAVDGWYALLTTVTPEQADPNDPLPQVRPATTGGSATDPPVIAITRGIQLHLLDLLSLEPTHPRWPET